MVGLAGIKGTNEGERRGLVSAIATTEGHRASPCVYMVENAVHHDPLTGSVLIYKHMIGLLAVKRVHIYHSLAVSLEPLG